jgi:anti-sigma-K factor RskA
MSEMTVDPGHSDALAAEYVLGTLEFDERSQAQTLLGTDENFAAKVRVWERRLGELHVMVEPVEPHGRIWERIKLKIPQAQPSPEVKPTEPEPQGPPQAPPEESTSIPSTPTPATSAPPSMPTAPTLVLAALESALSGPDKAPAGTSDATAVATPATTPATPSDAAQVGSETVLSPAPTPPAASAPILTSGVTSAPPVERHGEARDLVAVMRRRVGRWRAFAVLMTLLVVAVAALLAAWRFVPERVPPLLQPVELMRLVGVSIGAGPPPRPPAPPESQFDE